MLQECQVSQTYNISINSYLTVLVPKTDQKHPRVPEINSSARIQYKEPLHESISWLNIGRSRALILDGSDARNRREFMKLLLGIGNRPLYIPEPDQDLFEALEEAYKEGCIFFYQCNLCYDYDKREVLAILDKMYELLVALGARQDFLRKTTFGIVISGNQSYVSDHPIAHGAWKIEIRYSRPLVALPR